MIYLICFAVSSLFIFFSEKTKGFKHRFCLLTGIMIPAVLAGLRSSYVGTDVYLYARQVFESGMGASSWSWMQKWNEAYGVEYGYLLLNHIITRFTENIAWQFFLVELFILVFIYQAFAYFKRNISDNISLSYMFLIYYFLMYNETLNLMRQSMAVAVIVYGFRYVYERKLPKYVLVIGIAMQFHITALLAIFVYPIYFFVCVQKKYSLKYVLSVISLASGAILGRIIGFITNIGVFGDKFLKYFREGTVSSININQLVIRIPFIIIFWYIVIKRNRKRAYYNFIIVMLLLDLAFAELRGIDETLYRLSLYFSVFKCVSYPEMVNVFAHNNRRLVKILILGFGLSIWFYQIVLMNNGHTYPYMFNTNDVPVRAYSF